MVWWYVAIFAASLLLVKRAKPKIPSQTRKPAGIQQFSAPTADPSREIPVLFGTKMLSAPNILWYGDMRNAPIVRENTVVGHQYFMGAHLGFCHGPITEISEMYIDDKKLPLPQVIPTTSDVMIEAEGLFGGEDHDGGFVGKLYVMFGFPTQTGSRYLQDLLSHHLTYRGVLSIVIHRSYVGTRNRLPSFQILATRTTRRVMTGHQTPYANWAQKNGDMNPVVILHELLTDPVFGAGHPESSIDQLSFDTAASILYNEDLMLSFLWDQSTDVKTFIETVLDHIDGSLVVDQTTGKFKLILIREVQSLTNVKEINEENIISIENFKRDSISDLTDTVTVVYSVKNSSKTASVTVENPVLTNGIVGRKHVTKQFIGITNPSVAHRVAMRELRAMSTPLVSCSVYINRWLVGFDIGDVIKMSWRPYGIQQIYMRVVDIETGDIDDNKVKLTLVQDVFLLPAQSFGHNDTGWTDPNVSPQAPTNSVIIDTPFYFYASRYGNSVNDAYNDKAEYGLILAKRSTPNLTVVESYDNENDIKIVHAFSPYAILAQDIKQFDVKFKVRSETDFNRGDVVNKYGFFITTEHTIPWIREIVQIVSYNENTKEVTVNRGALHSVPTREIPAGTELFVFPGMQNFRLSTIRRTRLRYCSSSKCSDYESVPILQGGEYNLRKGLYPVGRVSFNGSFDYSATYNVTNGLTIGWAHRNRQNKPDSHYWTQQMSPESNAVYDVQVYLLLGQRSHSIGSGKVTGSSYTISRNEILSRIPPGTHNVQVAIRTLSSDNDVKKYSATLKIEMKISVDSVPGVVPPTLPTDPPGGGNNPPPPPPPPPACDFRADFNGVQEVVGTIGVLHRHHGLSTRFLALLVSGRPSASFANWTVEIIVLQKYSSGSVRMVESNDIEVSSLLNQSESNAVFIIPFANTDNYATLRNQEFRYFLGVYDILFSIKRFDNKRHRVKNHVPADRLSFNFGQGKLEDYSIAQERPYVVGCVTRNVWPQIPYSVPGSNSGGGGSGGTINVPGATNCNPYTKVGIGYVSLKEKIFESSSGTNEGNVKGWNQDGAQVNGSSGQGGGAAVVMGNRFNLNDPVDGWILNAWNSDKYGNQIGWARQQHFGIYDAWGVFFEMSDNTETEMWAEIRNNSIWVLDQGATSYREIGFDTMSTDNWIANFAPDQGTDLTGGGCWPYRVRELPNGEVECLTTQWPPMPTQSRNVPGGGVAYKIRPGRPYVVAHFAGKRVSVPRNMESLLVLFEARVSPSTPNAKLGMHIGGDPKIHGNNAADRCEWYPGFGLSKVHRLTNEWQLFGFTPMQRRDGSVRDGQASRALSYNRFMSACLPIASRHPTLVSTGSGTSDGGAPQQPPVPSPPPSGGSGSGSVTTPISAHSDASLMRVGVDTVGTIGQLGGNAYNVLWLKNSRPGSSVLIAQWIVVQNGQRVNDDHVPTSHAGLVQQRKWGSGARAFRAIYTSTDNLNEQTLATKRWFWAVFHDPIVRNPEPWYESEINTAVLINTNNQRGNYLKE